MRIDNSYLLPQMGATGTGAAGAQMLSDQATFEEQLNAAKKKIDLSFIKSSAYGGEKVDKTWESNINASLRGLGSNSPVLNGYGMTETASTVLYTYADHPEGLIPFYDVNVRISTLEYLIKLADDLSNMDYNYHMFIDYLDNIYEDDKARIDIPVSVIDDNSVRIMTIHASKGLEYHICYYPEVSNEFNMQDINSKILYDSIYGITLPSYTDGYSDTITKILAKRKFIKEEVSEKIRLFYVALTRVKEKMIIITNIEKDDIKNKEDFRSFKDIINSVKEDLEKYIKDIDLDDLNISRDYLSMIVSKLPDYPKQELNVKEYISNTEIEEDKHFSKEIKELITKEKLGNMKYGTKIHELFEIIDFKNLELEKLNITSKEKEYITNFLNQDLLKDIKEANILKEYEFYTEDNKHGIIDLMLEYSDHIDIIDYKLKHVDDIEYLKQLNGYKEYISLKTNKPVNIYLYSILDNNIKQV